MTENNLEQAAKTANENGSIITTDTVISGDVNSTSALKVYGEVKGNVCSTKTVEVFGRVIGDVSGECVVLVGGNLQGNITSKTKVTVGKDVILVGDIKADELNASGKIKGTIDVTKLITLENTAVCEGSISASLINIKTGAKIKGPITIFDSESDAFDSKAGVKAVKDNNSKSETVTNSVGEKKFTNNIGG